jgi:hypothetical protein
MNLPFVATVAKRLDGWAVIGAYALAARGYVRQTADLDLMTADSKALDESLWTDLRDQGARVEVRRGDFEDPLAGVVRLEAKNSSIDIVVARMRWQKAVIDRAEVMHIGSTNLNIVRASDLILLKLFAGGYSDLHDIRRLLDIESETDLVSEVTQSLADLPEEMRELWQRLLAGNGG